MSPSEYLNFFGHYPPMAISVASIVTSLLILWIMSFLYTVPGEHVKEMSTEGIL